MPGCIFPRTNHIKAFLPVFFADLSTQDVDLAVCLPLSVVVTLFAPSPPGSFDREKRNAVTSATSKAASDDLSNGGGKRGSGDGCC